VNSPGETLPSKRFALSLPDVTDTEFDRIRDHLIDTVHRAAIRLRTKCAIENAVAFWETDVTITPDPDRPNVIIVTARPRAIPSPENAHAEVS
jgi:hypothetical protein